MLGLVDSALGVVRVESVDLGGDTAGDDLEDLSTETDKETVSGSLSLSGKVTEC